MTTAAQTPTPEPPVSKRLTRSSGDRVIAGVAGGFGRYVGVDPVVIRLALIVLVFFGGAGLVLYGAAWLIVPSDDKEGAASFDGRDVARRTGIALGILALTIIAAAGGFWGFATGGGTATAIVVIVVGAALVIGAFTGGTRWLIVPALVLALSAGAVAAADLDVRGGVGERIYRPATGNQLRSEYKLGIGHLRLDLRNTDLSPGTHRVHLKLGVGQAEVLVPDNVCVASTAHISAGETSVFDHSTGGADHDWQDDRTAPEGTPVLKVDADIGFGELRIAEQPDLYAAGNEACDG